MKFIVQRETQTITKSLVESDNETDARNNYDTIEQVTQTTDTVTVKPYSALVKADNPAVVAAAEASKT